MFYIDTGDEINAKGKTMVTKILIGIIIAAVLLYIIVLIKKIIKNYKRLKEEPGNPVLLALYCAALEFLAAFGVSEFPISIVVYNKFKLVDDKNVPGTLINSCVVPVACMSVGYILAIKVETVTLFVCIVAGLIGAFIGTLIIARMNTSSLQLLMISALVIAAVTTALKISDIIPAGGSAFGFYGWKLALVAIITCILCMLNMGGFATTSILLSIYCLMGLNPTAAFPLAMSSCSLACIIGGLRYVQLGNFNLKLPAISSVFGSIGAIVAVFIVKDINVTIIQWLILVVIVYSAITMILERIKNNYRNQSKIKKEVEKHG